MRGNTAELAAKLSYTFKDVELLATALRHRSVGKLNNERLEFLGDSILGLIISKALYHRYPQADEGRLTRMRASLVKGETLAVIARELDLGHYLQLGSGELKSGGFRRDSILADAVEAIIGAVYLDGGLAQAEPFVLELMGNRLDEAGSTDVLKDPKTRLQEYLQARQLPLPSYEVHSITGKDHKQVFKVSCKVSLYEQVFNGQGNSRRKAEQDAASQVIHQLGI